MSKSTRLTDTRGYALTDKKIIKIDHELNGVYYGEVLGNVYAKDGSYSESTKYGMLGVIIRQDERDNALVYIAGEK